jgi:two-component system phosphate regulon response regulator PhoB
MSSVLVIEDSPDERKILRLRLAQAGYAVQVAATGREGLRLARAQRPDIILLDVMLPDVPGTNVCKALKEEAATENIPVIIVSARDEEIDRVVGFELGADDYVVKPFSMRELLLRIEAVMRRSRSPLPLRSMTLGLLRVERDAHRTWVDGAEVTLSAMEFSLLLTFCERQDRLLSREEILTSVWTIEADNELRTVDSLVRRLRAKLGAAGKYIETLHGSGYRFSIVPDK